jgi:hypothetical protein
MPWVPTPAEVKLVAGPTSRKPASWRVPPLATQGAHGALRTARTRAGSVLAMTWTEAALKLSTHVYAGDETSVVDVQ